MAGELILIVEDEEKDRKLARDVLEVRGYRTLGTSTGEEAIDLARDGDDLRDRITSNAAPFRGVMSDAGFELLGAGHPIIPVLLGDAILAGKFAARLLERGVYVTAFSFPVVPHGTARIRTQMNAAHTTEQLDRAIEVLVDVGHELEVIA